MRTKRQGADIDRVPTGMPGFDLISHGGLPADRSTLITGTPGSGKTMFAVQFLAEGIRRHGQSGVFVTFEESTDDLRKNFISLGWDIEKWESENKWRFVDVSPHAGQRLIRVGKFDLSALLTRIGSAVEQVGAKRVALDSLGAIFTQVTDRSTLRSEIFRIMSVLKEMEVTAVLTGEHGRDDEVITRSDMEEFTADNVVITRNIREDERRRRTIEILKFRGTTHEKGEHPFTIIRRHGIVVLPLSSIELKQKSTEIRMTSGNVTLDGMCDGGYFRDFIVAVNGPTGTGKSLMATEFVKGGLHEGDRCLFLGFEESKDQIFRNASRWGIDFAGAESAGLLKVSCEYPEAMGLEDHSQRLRTLVKEFKPNRLALDSLSALERVASGKGYRKFVVGLTAFLKQKGIASLLTVNTPAIAGSPSMPEAEISSLADAIILLRYVEVHGEMRRGLTVLKMRGTSHDKEIREFAIDGTGMHIGQPFRNVSGILTGYSHNVVPSELERVGELFGESSSARN